MIYKFVRWDVPELKTLKNSFEYRIYHKLKKGEKLTNEEKQRVAEALFTNSYSKKGMPLRGWMFYLEEYLHEYFVEFTYGNIQRHYALDRTSLRSVLHSVSRIVEIR
jgi:hypothetical protein